MDAWLIELYIKQMSKFETSTNPLVAAMFTTENIGRCRRTEKYQPPEALFHLNSSNPLIDDLGRTLHFNHRIRDGGMNYVTEQ